MPSQKKVQWLLDQLPGWLDSDQIGEQAADQIRREFSEELDAKTQSDRRNLYLVLVSAVMIGAGIISLVSWNWDALSRPTKSVLAVIPWLSSCALLAYSLFCLQSARRQIWVEGAAVLQSLCNGAALSLIALIYPSGGDITGLLLLWSVMQLPLIYITGAVGSTVIYLYIVVAYLFSVDLATSSTGYFWGLLILAIPQAFLILTGKPGRLMTMLLWSFALVLLFGLLLELPREPIIAALIFSGFIGIGILAFSQRLPYANESWRTRPFELIGGAGVICASLLFTLDDFWIRSSLMPLFVMQDLLEAVVKSVLIIAYTVSTILLAMNRRWFSLSFMAFPFVVTLSIVANTVIGLPLFGWLFNLYLTFAICAWVIVSASRSLNVLQLNLAVMLLLVQVLLRVFLSDLGLLLTGIVLLASGLIMLGLNWTLNAKLKHTDKSSQAL